MISKYFKLLCLTGILLTTFSSGSQNTDSLIRALKSAQRDTNKVFLLNILAKIFENTDAKKSYDYINEALVLSENLGYNKGLAKAYLNKGNYYFRKSDYNTAIGAYSSSLLTNKKIGDKDGMASAYTGIGLVYTYKGDYAKAVDNYFKGLELKEQSGHLQGQAVLYSNIGELYMYQGQYENSLKYHTKSLEIEKKLNNEEGIAESYSNIASVHFYLKRPELALEYYNMVVDIARKNGYKAELARGLNNIGSVFEFQKKYDSAISNFYSSLKIKEEVGDKNGIANASLSLGRIYKKLNRDDESIEFILKSIEISELIDSKKNLKEAYEELASIYEKRKNFEKAIFYFRQSAALKDSILNEKISKTIFELETRYETDKKEKEIILLTKENKIQDLELNKNKITIYSTIIVIILLVFLAATILKRYQLKQKVNKIITEQKAIVDQKQKEILDSINYAKRIQYTLIAHSDFLQNNLKEYFVLFKPKDIVSGDFYWATKKKDRFYLAVCDSTGHGVPGAFMSLLSIGFLSEAINEKNIEKPNDVLNYVRERLIENISKEEQKDGFDGILMCIDSKNNSISYASAYNSPIIIEDNILTELLADKMPVGKGERTDSFNLFPVTAKKGSMVYLITDGYADQFGGPQGKKYKYKQLNNLLLSVAGENMEAQNKKLTDEFEKWKGNLEQIDDVCIFGFRI